MALKKDKQKVLGETFDNERIMTFFDYKPQSDSSPDYHLLEKAYRGMKADNFSTFLTFFKEKGFDINAKSPQGSTFLQTISAHQQAQNYVTALKNQGAV